MRAKTTALLLMTLLAGVLVGVRLSTQAQTGSVQPARVERMQNLGVRADESRRPAYLPAEWGRLVAVEKTGSTSYTLFFQADDGPVYVVRLVQSGDYLFLDTYDEGGVALVLERKP